MTDFVEHRRQPQHSYGAPMRDSDATGHGSQSNVDNTHLYTDTPQDAVVAFTAAGLPIKLRTAQRYCEKAKVDAIRIDPETGQETENRSHYSWLINPASYTSLWANMREQLERQGHKIEPRQTSDSARHGATSRDSSQSDQVNQSTTTRDSDATSDDQSRRDATNESDLRSKIKELESKLTATEIEKQAAHQVRDMVIEQSSGLIDKLEKTQYALGAAEAQLKSLGAPTTQQPFRDAA